MQRRSRGLALDDARLRAAPQPRCAVGIGSLHGVPSDDRRGITGRPGVLPARARAQCDWRADHVPRADALPPRYPQLCSPDRPATAAPVRDRSSTRSAQRRRQRFFRCASWRDGDVRIADGHPHDESGTGGAPEGAACRHRIRRRTGLRLARSRPERGGSADRAAGRTNGRYAGTRRRGPPRRA